MVTKSGLYCIDSHEYKNWHECGLTHRYPWVNQPNYGFRYPYGTNFFNKYPLIKINLSHCTNFRTTFQTACAFSA